MERNYVPRPIDASSVQLGSDLTALIERLAENAHDVWASQRLHDGWTWGPRRDDVARAHPCLIPYRELSEAEKEYDRRLVLDTIRAIVACGYRISPPPADAAS